MSQCILSSQKFEKVYFPFICQNLTGLMAYRAEGIVTIMTEIFKNSMPRRIPISEEKETTRFSQFAANISHEENIPKRQILIIWTKLIRTIHTCASVRTTAITRLLYSSIVSGGNKKCLLAYSCI